MTPSDPRRPAPGKRPALLMLTAVAGAVDAAAYLALGQVFVANQTGNGVLLAAGIAHLLLPELLGASHADQAVHAAVSLAGFVAGAAAAAAVAHQGPRLLPRSRPLWESRWTLPAVEAATLLTAAFAPVGDPAAAAVAAAGMGVQSVRAVREKVSGVPTTVVTGTLAQLFANLAAKPRSFTGTWYLALVWLVYVVAALAGAAAVAASSFAAVATACAALVLAATGVDWWVERRARRAGRGGEGEGGATSRAG